MTVRRLYCPALRVGINQPPPGEVRHLVASLRARVGDHVTLFDGRGREGNGVVTRIDRDGADIEVGECSESDPPSPIRLTLACAVARQHRQAYLVEKCTELGIDTLIPLHTDRGVATADETARERWERRAIEACKQCWRSTVPTIDPPRTVEDVLVRREAFSHTCCAHPALNSTGLQMRVDKLRAGDSILVFIGPEGGWSDREVKLFGNAAVDFVSLAAYVLRVETAALAVCAVVAARAASLGGSVPCA